MPDKLAHLYHPSILEHNENPLHFEKRPTAAIVLNAYNPLCGDKFKLFLDLENGLVVKATFHGYGCAVSKASTSILMKKIQGQTVETAQEIVAAFFRVFEENEPPQDEESASFFVAKEFPSRLKCAQLSWLALDDFFKTGTSEK